MAIITVSSFRFLSYFEYIFPPAIKDPIWEENNMAGLSQYKVILTLSN